MEEAPENGKESLHSAHANGVNEGMLFEILHKSILYMLKVFIFMDR
jgi:hypothetical protein